MLTWGDDMMKTDKIIRVLTIESQKLANRIDYDTPSDTGYYVFFKAVVDDFLRKLENNDDKEYNKLTVYVKEIQDKLGFTTEQSNTAIRRIENSGLLDETHIKYLPFVSQFELRMGNVTLEL